MAIGLIFYMGKGKEFFDYVQSIEDVEDNNKLFNEQQYSTKDKVENIEAKGREGYFMLRKWWSSFLLGWISFLILSHTALTWAIGFGMVNYEQHKILVNILAGETFLQIVALGIIAVRFLFSDTK